VEKINLVEIKPCLPGRPSLIFSVLTELSRPHQTLEKTSNCKKLVIFLFVRNGAGCEVKHSKMNGAVPPLSHMPSLHAQGQLELGLHKISEILSSLQKKLSTRIKHTSRFRAISFIRCYPLIGVKCKTGYNLANRSRRPAGCCM
jgi:hypothetical protein